MVQTRRQAKDTPRFGRMVRRVQQRLASLTRSFELWATWRYLAAQTLGVATADDSQLDRYIPPKADGTRSLPRLLADVGCLSALLNDLNVFFRGGMLFLHGGSYVVYAPQDAVYRSLASRLALRCGAPVFTRCTVYSIVPFSVYLSVPHRRAMCTLR